MDSFVERMILEQGNMNGLKHQLHLSDLRIKKYLRADEFEAVEREEYNRQLILKQMEAKNKAKELVQNYLYKIIEFAYVETNYKALAKQCALIAVDEILKELYEWGEVWMKRRIEYWQEVKKYISYE